MYNLFLTVAGLKINFKLRSLQTELYFREFGGVSFTGDQSISCPDLFVPAVKKDRLLNEHFRLGGTLGFAEYSLLLEAIANPILKLSRFFFHGAAFIWKGQAFLFVGKSGVGKTTMLRHWLNLYGEELEIINGDKPVIEQCENHFIVHPSPWTGKEGWNGERSARLAGIICLEQGKTNSFIRIDKQSAVFPIFLQFLYQPTDETSVDLVCRYEQALLENVPVWRFISDGSSAAAVLAYNILSEEAF